MKNNNCEKKEIVYICNQTPNIEEDEIDLKELFKTIGKYKKFIFSFTFIITLMATIYAYIQKPIYEIKANIQLGYIHTNTNTNTNTNKLYLIDPSFAKIYLETNYGNLIITRNNIKDILSIKIYSNSNKNALDYLNTIIKDLQQKENKKLKSYSDYINSQITLLKNQKKEIIKTITKLKSDINSIKNANKVSVYLTQISNYQNQLFNIESKINDYKQQLSPLNITQTQIIGKVLTNDYPIKPKKKLIITVAFITSFILSIFIIFFIEFIKSIKEDDKD